MNFNFFPFAQDARAQTTRLCCAGQSRVIDRRLRVMLDLKNWRERCGASFFGLRTPQGSLNNNNNPRPRDDRKATRCGRMWGCAILR
jgi:hypothetical protein